MLKSSARNYFLDSLRRASNDELDRLYAQPCCACLLLRNLEQLGKTIIMLLLHIDTPIDMTTVRRWFSPKVMTSLRSTVEDLAHLRVLDVYDNGRSILLRDTFRAAMMRNTQEGILTASGLKPAGASARIEKKARKSRTDLHAYATKQWETVLQFLALCNRANEEAISTETRDVFLFANFVKERTGGASRSTADEELLYEITSDGFQFLLLDRRKQLWRYLIAHLDYLTSRGVNRVPLMILLCQVLTATTVEVPYLKSEEMSGDVAQEYMHHLREIGLLNMRKRKESWFYVTPFVELLNGSALTTVVGTEESQHFLVVETNFRIYAYTSSELQLAILSTFAEIDKRFEHMAVARVSRSSVRRALQCGIDAEQIITYLREHAHSQMTPNRISGDVVPYNVADHIRLWKLERDRFIFTPAIAYTQFDSSEAYERLESFVNAEGMNLWSSADARMIVVPIGARDAVKTFWKSSKK